MPIYRLPLTLTSRTGVRCALGDDPVDDLVFKHVHGPESALYFPNRATAGPPGLILDVGAHRGIYAMEALRRYPSCRLIAIEPDPRSCRQIEVNAALNHLGARIEIVQAGLAKSGGRGWLEAGKDGSWGSRTRAAESEPESNAPAAMPARNALSSVAGSGISEWGWGPTRKEVEATPNVDLKTLDMILGGRRPAIVKCNAEGAEFALIPQLIALGLTPRAIVLMIHPDAGNPGELLGQLRDAGFEVTDADSPPSGHRFHCFLEDAEAKERAD